MRGLGIGIIGTGRVGRALAVRLARAGWRIAGVHDKSIERAAETARIVPTGYFQDMHELAGRADILFLTVPDGEIARVAEDLGEIRRLKAMFIFHTSGILPARILHLAGTDRAVYSLHPFGGITGNSSETNPFRGLFFSGEGDGPARPLAVKIVSDLDGKFVPIKSDSKSEYHLAASLLANHSFALFSSAEKLLATAGLAGEHISEMIHTIAQKAADNYRDSGLFDGLTGPVARGDELTIAEHIIAARKAGIECLYDAGVSRLREILRNGGPSSD